MSEIEKEVDPLVTIFLELTEHEFYVLAKGAHELDLTFNKYVEKILLDFLEKENNNV